MSKTNSLLKKIFIVVMLTLIPIIIIKQLWLVILTYWRIMLSAFFLGAGSIFIFFYFKAYNIKVVIFKFKNFLSDIGLREKNIADKNVNLETAERSKSFLTVGITLELAGVYLLNQFILDKYK